MKKKLIALGIDLLAAGLILLTFAYFHHGKRFLEGKKEAAQAATQSVLTAPDSFISLLCYDSYDSEEGSAAL